MESHRTGENRTDEPRPLDWTDTFIGRFVVAFVGSPLEEELETRKINPRVETPPNQREVKITDLLKSVELSLGQANWHHVSARVCFCSGSLSARHYVVPYRVGRELTRTATNSGADMVPICLSETQFETFQEIRDFDFFLGSGGVSTLVGAFVDALVGALVGTLVDPLVAPLVGPLVGQISLSSALCVAH